MTGSAGPLTRITVDPTADPRWRSLVGNHRTDVFHSPAWCAVLADTYQMPISAHLVLDGGGTAVAGMAVATVDDVLGRRRISLPFSDFCDPIAATPAHWRSLTDELDRDAPLRLRCLRSDLPLRDPRFTVIGRARWHVVELDEGLEELWNRVDPRARRSIRKARMSGIEVRPAECRQDLRRFFDLHLRVRKYKYGLLTQPSAFFEQIWKRIVEPGDGVLLLARHGGEVIGGVLYLEWGDTLYYKFNASDHDHLNLRPNDLLAWSGIEHALQRGLQRFDFGLTDWDQEGLIRYKEKYASRTAIIHALSSASLDVPPWARAWRQDLSQVTRLLTDRRVPDDVTEAAGDALYHHFA